MPKERKLCNFVIGTIVWPFLGKLGSYIGYFYIFFASRCLKWLKFSLESHASQIEEYHQMSNYMDSIRAMFGPYEGHVLDISTISLLLDA